MPEYNGMIWHTNFFGFTGQYLLVEMQIAMQKGKVCKYDATCMLNIDKIETFPWSYDREEFNGVCFTIGKNIPEQTIKNLFLCVILPIGNRQYYHLNHTQIEMINYFLRFVQSDQEKVCPEIVLQQIHESIWIWISSLSMPHQF